MSENAGVAAGRGLKPVRCFHGNDEFRVRDAVLDTLERLVPKSERQVALFRFDNQNADLAAMAEAVQSVPLFSDYAVVTIDDADALPRDVKEHLPHILAQRAPSTSVIVSYKGDKPPEKELYVAPKGQSKADKERSEKAKGILAGFMTQEFNTLKEGQFRQWVMERAEEEGLVLSREGARLMIERLGDGESGRVAGEITKYASILPEGSEVEEDLIDRLTPHSKEGATFAVIDHILARDTGSALESLDLLARGGSRELIPLVNLLGAQVAATAYARAVKDADPRRSLPQDVPYGWKIEKTRSWENWTSEELNTALDDLYAIDLLSKRGAVPDQLLERFILSNCPREENRELMQATMRHSGYGNVRRRRR